MAGIEDLGNIVCEGVRKLFKLGKALNVPRGVHGQLSTAFGSLSSALDQQKAAVVAEERTIRAIAVRQEKEKLRTIVEEKERPIAHALIEREYMRGGERVLKKTLHSVFASNADLMKQLHLSANSSKADMVEALLTHGSHNTLRFQRAVSSQDNINL